MRVRNWLLLATLAVPFASSAATKTFDPVTPPFYTMPWPNELAILTDQVKKRYLDHVFENLRGIPGISVVRPQLDEAARDEDSWTEFSEQVFNACEAVKSRVAKSRCSSLIEARILVWQCLSPRAFSAKSQCRQYKDER